MKIHCLLVDDEPQALKVLQSHISAINGIEIVGQCKNAIEAMDILHEKSIDLIFLDIKMPKLLGTDFLRSLSQPPRIIFVTAYRDYAVDSYELDVVDYLLKPVSFERFMKAIAKVKKIMGHDPISQPEEIKKYNDAFVYLKVDRDMKKFIVKEITYIESWKDYVKIFLSTGINFLVKKSISSMEILLSEHSFIRVHRSYLVAIDKISSYNHYAVFLGTTEIPIGRLYKQRVIDIINDV
jgi:DNA-binding LytR/AlgR family response regulator